jgi:CubicO group peptidase (beta-lactamase class C family)
MKRRGLAPVTDMIAPTAECPWRERILCGEVHDDNAWAMGGVAGHAGLFSTARDVHAFATEMIDCYHGRGGLVSQDTVRKFWTLDNSIEGSSWALGWDTPSPEHSSSGRYFSRNSVGHLGFTGCSLWIDPDRELDVVLLSNRVHPNPENNLIREFRPLIHDLVMETLGLAES